MVAENQEIKMKISETVFIVNSEEQFKETIRGAAMEITERSCFWREPWKNAEAFSKKLLGHEVRYTGASSNGG